MGSINIAPGTDNNFNLIRMLAACSVVFSHSYVLVSGDPASEPLTYVLGISLGHLAVDVFFIASGFLISGSLFRRSSIREFLWARALRVFPGLWVMLLLTVLVFGPLVSALPGRYYFSEWGTWKYLIKNAILIFNASYSLPGVFENIPYSFAVNGSLWSLPIEIRMYLLLAVLWFTLGLLKRQSTDQLKWVVWIIVITSMATLMYYNAQGEQINHNVRLAAVFFCGVLLQIYKSFIRVSSKVALLLFALLVAAWCYSQSLFLIVYYVSLPYLIIYIAYCQVSWVSRLKMKDDISYGIYIYSFPIQQLLILKFVNITPGIMFSVSLALTAPLAFVSWRLIEEKCIQLKRKPSIQTV